MFLTSLIILILLRPFCTGINSFQNIQNSGRTPQLRTFKFHPHIAMLLGYEESLCSFLASFEASRTKRILIQNSPIMWVGLLFSVMSISAFLNQQDVRVESQEILQTYRTLTIRMYQNPLLLSPPKFPLSECSQIPWIHCLIASPKHFP